MAVFAPERLQIEMVHSRAHVKMLHPEAHFRLVRQIAVPRGAQREIVPGSLRRGVCAFDLCPFLWYTDFNVPGDKAASSQPEAAKAPETITFYAAQIGGC